MPEDLKREEISVEFTCDKCKRKSNLLELDIKCPFCHSAPKGCCAIDIFGQHEINCPKFGSPPESPNYDEEFNLRLKQNERMKGIKLKLAPESPKEMSEFFSQPEEKIQETYEKAAKLTNEEQRKMVQDIAPQPWDEKHYRHLEKVLNDFKNGATFSYSIEKDRDFIKSLLLSAREEARRETAKDILYWADKNTGGSGDTPYPELSEYLRKIIQGETP